MRLPSQMRRFSEPDSRIQPSVFSAHTALNSSNTALFSVKHFFQRCPLKAHPVKSHTWLAGRYRNTAGLGYQAVYFYFAFSQCIKPGPQNLKICTVFRRRLLMTLLQNNIAVGKYLVSPLAKPQGSGGYTASVSIRSGRGSATHDRVLRFSGLFDSAAAAVHYATEHALGWIRDSSSTACA